MQCRLRAHHRAPCRAAVGQGGHACELQECPHCSKQLAPGLPHVGCALGLAAPKQAAKRRRLLKTRQDDEQQGSEGGVRQSLSSPALAPESPPVPALARAATFATGDDLPHELPTGADFMDTPQSVQTLAVAPSAALSDASAGQHMDAMAQNLLPPEGSEASGSDAGQQPRQVAPPLEQLVTAFVQAVMQTQQGDGRQAGSPQRGGSGQGPPSTLEALLQQYQPALAAASRGTPGGRYPLPRGEEHGCGDGHAPPPSGGGVRIVTGGSGSGHSAYSGGWDGNGGGGRGGHHGGGPLTATDVPVTPQRAGAASQYIPEGWTRSPSLMQAPGLVTGLRRGAASGSWTPHPGDAPPARGAGYAPEHSWMLRPSRSEPQLVPNGTAALPPDAAASANTHSWGGLAPSPRAGAGMPLSPHSDAAAPSPRYLRPPSSAADAAAWRRAGGGGGYTEGPPMAPGLGQWPAGSPHLREDGSLLPSMPRQGANLWDWAAAGGGGSGESFTDHFGGSEVAAPGSEEGPDFTALLTVMPGRWSQDNEAWAEGAAATPPPSHEADSGSNYRWEDEPLANSLAELLPPCAGYPTHSEPDWALL